MHYLILCYDISENKIRTRLYNYLLKSGSIPLQKSVHILPHNFKNKAEKIGWIQQYIVPKLKGHDQIHVIPFTQECINGMQNLKTHIDLSFLQKEEITII